MPRDYYEVLGVNKDATQDQIKSAFRALTKKYHPDLNKAPGTEEKFKEIAQAYEVLGDEQKRRQYDQFGPDGPSGNPFGGGAGFGGAGGVNLDDLLNSMFGGGGGRGARAGRSRDPNAPQPGEDLEYGLEITLEDAAFGVEKEIRFKTYENCARCSGTGCEPGTTRTTCPRCHGTGAVTMSQGFFAMQQPCPECNGTGYIIKKPCKECRGAGRKSVMRTVKLNIPPGVDTGSRVRAAGHGYPGRNGGEQGDLYVSIRVKDHDVFERDGLNLHVLVPIDPLTAMLGGTIEVPTITGKAKLRIEPGTQNGTKLRLSERGMPSPRGGGRGNLYIQLIIEMPQNLTSDQKEALQKAADIFEESKKTGQYPQTESFLRTAARFMK